MNTFRKYLLLILLLIGLTLLYIYLSRNGLIGDKRGELFTGWVVNKSGQVLSKANVKINEEMGITDERGVFKISVTPNDEYKISVHHPTHADLFHISRNPLTDQVWVLPSASVSTVDPTTPIVLKDTRPEIDGIERAGATFSLPPNALVDEQGNPPNGMLRGAIATLDLSSGEGPQEWGVRNAAGEEGFLVSYGAVFIEFTDMSGQKEYQIKEGMNGELDLPVIPSMLAHVAQAANAPFWYYEEDKGEWFKAGESVYNPNTGSYNGSVNHLSVINTDIAKFNNAACLAITLDPSIATGHQLRIRYHSGGTPFGQVPTFAMGHTLNAAYRLPGNTNVLLELLNASNQVLGNLVVEDPAGTPLPNTVANTGPALTPGTSLWPPSPFTPCKPITLRLGAPQVEIRINEMTSSPAPMDNPSDDYLTWAPTYAMARLASPMVSNVNIVLTNDSPNIGGNVRFANHQSPWPANTTATANTLNLTLPASGAWVPFMVAGEFNNPSSNDKDAIIEAHQNTASGTMIGSKALMVRVRKNANNLDFSEKNRYLFAWRTFRNKVSGLNYILAQEMHRLASQAEDEAHMQPAFLTWHRAFLLLVERELQAIDPSVALHYWEWDAAAPSVFSTDFIGERGDSNLIIDEPQFDITNPLLGWDTDLPFDGGELRRNTSDHTSDPGSFMKPLINLGVGPELLDSMNYGPTSIGFSSVESFSDDVEKFSHNRGHGWPCAMGHLTNPNRSAADPLFYLLHSQIDRQWAFWQEHYDRLGDGSTGTLMFPNPEHYDNTGAWNSPGNTPDPSFRQKGSYLDDGIWPWDGTTGGVGVEERPPNNGAAVGPTNNIPNSTPTIPSAAFPASPFENLWPATATIPRNRDMIDYLGRFDPINGLGFCYEDVPFN